MLTSALVKDVRVDIESALEIGLGAIPSRKDVRVDGAVVRRHLAQVQLGVGFPRSRPVTIRDIPDIPLVKRCVLLEKQHGWQL